MTKIIYEIKQRFAMNKTVMLGSMLMMLGLVTTLILVGILEMREYVFLGFSTIIGMPIYIWGIFGEDKF